MTVESAHVRNPYKAALARALASANTVAGDAATNLDTALGLMRSQAWVSSTADTFFDILAAQKRVASEAGRGSVHAIQRAYDAEPDMVDVNAWQVRWQRVV